MDSFQTKFLGAIADLGANTDLHNIPDPTAPIATGGQWDLAVLDQMALPDKTLNGHLRFDQVGAPRQIGSVSSRLVGAETFTVWVEVKRPNQSSPQRVSRVERRGLLSSLQQIDIPPATNLMAIDGAIALPIDGLTLPSISNPLYTINWALECEIHSSDGQLIGTCRVPVVVGEPIDRLRAAVIDLGEFALDTEATASGDGLCSIGFDRVPMLAGQPFMGTIRIAGLDASKLRMELRASVSTNPNDPIKTQLKEQLQQDLHPDFSPMALLGSQLMKQDGLPQALRETTVIWTGPLTPVADGSLSFSGIAPLSPSLDGPHGSVRTSMALVEDRKFRPDRSWSRAVAIANEPLASADPALTGPMS